MELNYTGTPLAGGAGFLTMVPATVGRGADVVRIAAGGIVVAGALLAAFVHPWFWVVPAFIGSGLVFSGVTDTCAMGMVLARMPWNRTTEQTCTS